MCFILQFLLPTALATLVVRNDLFLVTEMEELESSRMNMFEEAHSISSPWMELYVAPYYLTNGDLPFLPLSLSSLCEVARLWLCTVRVVEGGFFQYSSTVEIHILHYYTSETIPRRTSDFACTEYCTV